MKMFLICDNMDTKTGMRLAGIEGILVHGQQEVRDALAAAMKDKDIGLILINESLVDLVQPEIYNIKLNCQTPLIVEIPGRHGSKRASDVITRHVREAIGLKI
jgi:V/A-type H+-transporting ATPase subunit F